MVEKTTLYDAQITACNTQPVYSDTGKIAYPKNAVLFGCKSIQYNHLHDTIKIKSYPIAYYATGSVTPW
jgi:hypothetical protein